MFQSTLTRRRLLGNGAKLAAAFASTLLPPNVRKVLAAPVSHRAAAAASLHDIKHVVLLMQENRSFDHYFGTLPGVRGLNDPLAMQLSTGKSVFYQPDPGSPDGYFLPHHLDTQKTNAQKVPSTSHHWDVQHHAWNHGKMDKWLEAHRAADGAKAPFCMGYYQRADIPFQFALAEAFTICDAYHCSVMGPTWPNRLYWQTGMIDPDGKHGGPLIKNRLPQGGFTWTTYAERLEAAGISWKVYNHIDRPDAGEAKDIPSVNFPFNMYPHFRQFMEAPADSPLRIKGMTADAPDQFAKDCAADRLASVNWLTPPRIASEHPNHMPAAGAAFVSGVIDALAANPKVWAKTAFILNYDENDGIFDHVCPPTPPPGTPGEYIGGLPIGGGFRVPCIIVSPWTAGGWVCSQPFDHTSVLQFLEKFTGVREPNITDWRRQTFGDLISAFRFDAPKSAPPALPDFSRQLAESQQQAGVLPAPHFTGTNQSPPVQERGERHRTPVL